MSLVRTCGANFGKIKIFVFIVLKAQVRTSELHGHKKKKKKGFPNPLNFEVTGPDLWRQFWKNQNFCFYGLKGTGPDL